MKIFLLGDTSNRTNWGCRATTYFLKQRLRKCGDLSFSMDVADLRSGGIVCVDPRHEGPDALSARSTPSGVVQRLKTAIETAVPELRGPYRRIVASRTPASLGAFEKLGKALIAQRSSQLNRALEEADIVFINGEGSFLDDVAPGRLKLFFCWYAKKYFGKPVVIGNHTCDVSHPTMKHLAVEFYPLFDDVVFRDPISVENASAFLTRGRYGFGADVLFDAAPLPRDLFLRLALRPHFGLSYPDVFSQLDPSQPYICLGGSARYLFQKKRSFDAFTTFKLLAERLGRIQQVVIVGAELSDEEFLRPLARALHLPYFGTSTSIGHAIDLLANASLYVGGRWHTAIKAMLGGTPMVIFRSNTPYKSDGILRLAGLTQGAIDAFDVGTKMDTIEELARSHIEAGEALRSQVLARASELRATVERNFDWFRKRRGAPQETAPIG